MSHAGKECCMQSRWERTFQVEEWLVSKDRKAYFVRKAILTEAHIVWMACFEKSLGKVDWKAFTDVRKSNSTISRRGL